MRTVGSQRVPSGTLGTSPITKCLPGRTKRIPLQRCKEKWGIKAIYFIRTNDFFGSFTYSQMGKNVFKKFIKDMSLTKNPYFKKNESENKLILKGHLYFS